MTLRALFGYLVAAMLSAASVPAAVAHGQMAGSYQMVVCAGSDMATVTLDARGVPVDVVHTCPDCTAAAGLALIGIQGTVLLRPLRHERATGMLAFRLPAGFASFAPLARGPPLSV